MPTASAKSFDLKSSLLHAFAVNEAMNQHLLEHIDEAAWRADPPGERGRTIAAMAAHMHNVRLMLLKMSKGAVKIPAKLDRARNTRAQTRVALAATP